MKTIRNKYGWKRFWCPPNELMSLADGGYLVDPDEKWGEIFNPKVVPFERIAHIPCLILEGEPGIGKTTAIEAEKEIIESSIKDGEEDLLSLNLRSFGSEERLLESLFKNNKFLKWHRGKHRLHIYLDSLDECLLRIDYLATLLTDELKKYPTDRLFLRIACRTADVPKVLIDRLREIWGETNFDVFELVPLRKKDVPIALACRKIPEKDFLKQVEALEITSFSIKPITLELLMNIYDKDKKLPSEPSQIYKKGSLLLCDESNDDRRAAKATGGLTPEQRLIIAARIAFITVFSNKFAIWTESDKGDVPDEDVKIAELCGGIEMINGTELEVDEIAIREVLGTGLFSSRGIGRMGWSHQTYAEFLAALYIVEKGTSSKKILKLVSNSSDPDQKLIPQLHQTCGWICSLSPVLTPDILERDPEVLFNIGGNILPSKLLRKLLAKLFTLTEEKKFLDNQEGLKNRYKRLVYPQLQRDLKIYINDKAKNYLTRRVAIDIAVACELKILQKDLLSIAVDESDSLNARVHAMAALVKIGEQKTISKLVTLTVDPKGIDLEDELKGWALIGTWPNVKPINDIFSIITPAKNDRLIGSYRTFLSHHLANKLKREHFPAALKWTINKPEIHTLAYEERNIVKQILVRGWDYVNDDKIMSLYVEALIARLKHFDKLDPDKEMKGVDSLSFKMERDNSKRRTVILKVVELISPNGDDAGFLAYGETRLVLHKDLPWMIKRLNKAKNISEEKIWLQLIQRSYSYLNVSHSSLIATESKKNKALYEVFRWCLEPIKLGSKEAIISKREYMERKKYENVRPRKTIPLVKKNVKILLKQFEAGDLDAWWKLNVVVLEGNEFKGDLMEYPIWKELSVKTQERIFNAAKRYIEKYEIKNEDWIGMKTTYRPADAGYRALVLLLSKDQKYVEKLSKKLLGKWLPIILDFEEYEEKNSKKALIKIANVSLSEHIVNTLGKIIDNENKVDNYPTAINYFDECWDEKISHLVEKKLKNNSLKPSYFGSLLEKQFTYDFPSGKKIAEAYLKKSLLRSIARKKMVFAASKYLKNDPEGAFKKVWTLMLSDEKFGLEVLHEVSSFSRANTTFLNKLSEVELYELFSWMIKICPYSDKEGEADSSTIDVSLSSFRDAVLRNLMDKGTFLACDYIEKLRRTNKSFDWLDWTLVSARQIARNMTWVAPKPEQLMKYIANPQSGLVRNSDELMDVVLDSLERLESKLHSETPEVVDLWNHVGGKWTPKTEGDFSNKVKQHFTDDIKNRGIVSNREVEIRSGQGKGAPGQVTDIHIDAVVKGDNGMSFDVITLVIETKGSWNKNLNAEMKTQLVDRYLKNSTSQQGIYLIGWFNSSQWDVSDYRKSNSPKIPIEVAKKQFSMQAKNLSKDKLRIEAVILNTGLRQI